MFPSPAFVLGQIALGIVAGAVDPPAGKVLTDRSITLEAVVDARVEEVFARWTTSEGVRSFFGEDAVIEPRRGGRYEVYFLARSDSASDANSSRGARVLSIEPNRSLVFEWTSPPFAAELNTDPLPLWVAVRFEALDTEPPRTVVALASHGYGRGETWDRVYEFFVRAWGQVLYRLQRTTVDPGFHPHW